MNKKIFAVILSFLLIALSVMPAFADTHSTKTEKNVKSETIETLKKQLKENHKNKDLRKDVLKKLVEARKQENKDHIPVIINGNELDTDTPPVIRENRVLIPVRAVTNSLGATVTWDEATLTATITKTVSGSVYDSVYGSVYGSTYSSNTIKIEIKLGSGTAYVNGKEVQLDTKANTENNRMMVPLRFIAETFKSLVEWDPTLNCAVIEDQDSTETVPDNTKVTYKQEKHHDDD